MMIVLEDYGFHFVLQKDGVQINEENFQCKC